MKTLKKSAKKLQTIKTSTFLPAFGGYYGTLLGDLLEIPSDEIEYYNQDRDKRLPEITYDNLVLNYNAASKRLSEVIFNAVSGELESEGYVNKSTFENLTSPREYNFYNDSINCTFTFTPANIRKIKKYIKTWSDNWIEYLTRYKSRDGFISYHSHLPADWPLIESLQDQHKAGAILDFILSNEGFDAEKIYYKATDNFYLSEYITLNEPEISEELKAQIEEEDRLISNDPNQLSMEI